MKMYDQPVAVFDLDGCTVCNRGYKHLTAETWTWGAFEHIVRNAPPIKAVVDIWQNMNATETPVIVLTARPPFLLDTTKLWLQRYDLDYDDLVLMDEEVFQAHENARGEDISEFQAQWKHDWLLDFIKHDDVMCVFDDSKTNIDKFNLLGLTTFHTQQ